MLNKKRFKNLVVSKKTTTFASLFDQSTDVRICFYLGEMVEWSITTVLKTVVQRCTGGSNPSLSAEKTLQNK